jgi:stress-induced morphogen
MRNPMNPDAEVQAIYEVLKRHERSHPKAQIRSYRQNSGSIRIRVIDPDFEKLDKALRHDQIWELLEQLPEDIQSQITVVLLLTPEEAKTSFANMDFENPIPSRL